MAFARFDQPGDYIDGAFRVPESADGVITQKSPADLADEVGSFPFARAHVEAAVSAARKAFPAWRRQRENVRRRFLVAYQARLRANLDAIAETISREVGKPLWESRGEVNAMINKVELSLGEGAEWTRDRTIPDLPGEIRFRPHGVMAVIGPFNFPGHLPNGQFVPALMLGNTVVLKPSDKAPGVATWIARCFDEAGLPPGVFNVVQGEGTVASALAGHDGVDGILFTGSVAVGERIAVANASRFERIVALELGGKNASLVLDDADVGRAVREIAFAGYATAGQRCTATSRVFVQRALADRFIRELVDVAKSVRVGYPFDDGVFAGPMVSAASRDALFAAQAEARDAGFEPLVSGGPLEVDGHAGYYVRPAVHRAPGLAMRAKRYEHEELFGPDLAVYVFGDEADAYEAINATPFGLSAAVFTGRHERLEEAIDALRVGVIHWNRSSAGASSRLPFGGIKRSGNHHAASIHAGLACAYPLAVYLAPPEGSPPGSWPGFPTAPPSSSPPPG